MRIRTILPAFGVCAAVFAAGASDSRASSHREAPFITKNPKVDATDFYMFRSYESGRTSGDGYVTIIADYQPLQNRYGGPNYYTMDPDALYEIHIDNNGDAKENLTFQFRFQQALANSGKGIELPIAAPDGGAAANVGIPLRVGGLVNGTDTNLGAGSLANINESETYTVALVTGDRRTGTSADVTNASGGSKTFTKPLDNIGAKTFNGGYDAYANQYKYDINIPGCANPGKMFVGQRKEPFAVNLGTIFDLVNVPLSVIANPANRNAVANPLDQQNITSIALEIPTACLKGSSPKIAGWTSASVRQARVINPNASYGKPDREGGAWAQVSRLGNPLVNEVVIGIVDKDLFNSSMPKDDGTNFLKYVTNPTLPKLIELIYGAANAPAPTAIPRADLVTAFLTGITGVNDDGSTAEMLRLNTAIAPTTTGLSDFGAASCLTAGTSSMGAAVDTTLSGCDAAGFPNGRRPGDDVTDVALRVVMGRLLNTTVAPAGQVPLHDGVLQTASQFDTAFPYLKSPLGGS